MKEDILEQLVDDYLQLKGFFTVHNVKFKPDSNDPEYTASQDAVPSDVDVVAINPTKPKGPKRVWVVSCKSWGQGRGLYPDRWMSGSKRTERYMGERPGASSASW